MPPRRANRPDQLALDFATPEASWAERRDQVGKAVVQLGGDLHLRELLIRVLNCERDRGEPLVKSFAELALRPWGLCCSVSKARRTVAFATRAGILAVEDRRRDNQSQARNGYRLDWQGIRAVIFGDSPPAGACSQRTSGLLSENRGPVQPEQAHKRNNSSLDSRDSVPGRKAGPGRRALRKPTGASAPPAEILETLEIPESPSPESSAELGATAAGGCPPKRLASLVRSVPELAAAATRRVIGLDCRSLRYAIYQPVSYRHLQSPLRIVEWWRRQLTARRPATGDSEAELLLTLAAARYARELDATRVRTNRVAMWVSLLSRGDWETCLVALDEARAELDALLARYPDLLSSPTWPPDSARRAKPTEMHDA